MRASKSGSARRFAWSTIDQALSSASNFVLIFLIARGTSPSELGVIFIGYSLLTAGVVVCRNAFGAILGMDLPTIADESAHDLLARSLAAVAVTGVAVGGGLIAFASLVSLSSDARLALLLLGLAVPIVYLQDLQRFWAVAVGRPVDAAISDACWLAIAVAGFWLASLGSLEAATGAAAWVLGAILGTAVLCALGYRRRPRLRHTWSWVRADSRRKHLASDALLGQTAPLLTIAAITAIGGPVVTAAIRGAATLFGPLNLVSATIPLALVPEAIRSGPERARRLFLITAVGYGLVSLTWGLLLHFTPARVGHALLGETFPLAQAIILITAIEYVGLGMWGVSRARLRVQQRLRLALQLRVVFTIAAAVLPLAAIITLGDARAVAASMALTTMCLGVIAYAISRDRAVTSPSS